MPSNWANPFTGFLSNAFATFGTIQRFAADTPPTAALEKILEDRRFVFDIVDRVDTVATALDRLRSLYLLYSETTANISHLVEAQRSAEPTRRQFSVPDALVADQGQSVKEAKALVAFLYYEMSTISDLLKTWFTVPPNTHLEYLVGVRDKVLVHPRRDGFLKNSDSALSIGPILHPHLVGGESWWPWLRDWYLDQLATTGDRLDDEAGRDANVALLLSRTWVKNFTPVDRLKLKAYVIPEPDLLQSACELATLLEASFSPEVGRACSAN